MVCVAVNSSQSERNCHPLKAVFRVGNDQSHLYATISAGVFLSQMQTCCFVFKLIFLQLKQHSISWALFLYQHVKTTCTMFVLALNDAENIPLFENIIIVHALFNEFLSTHPSIRSKNSWLTGVNH